MPRQQRRDQEQPEQLYRVREGFAVPGDGHMRAYTVGQLLRASDPIATSHRALLEPAQNGAVEAATAAPGERRSVQLPTGASLAEATAHRTGHAHETSGDNMPFRDHSITPDDPRSPASPFAPAQPAAGVVAADVPDEQNLAGGPKPDEVSESTVSGYLAETNNGGPGTVDAPAGEPVQDSGSEDFDPSQSSVAQVNAYLDTASDDERERVLSAERAGQNRKGIVG